MTDESIYQSGYVIGNSYIPSLSHCSSGSDFAMQRFDRDSEVYKMIQENKESRTAPRQSNTFRMLQEVLESDEKGEQILP